MDNYDIWLMIGLWTGAISLAGIGVTLFFSVISFTDLFDKIRGDLCDISTDVNLLMRDHKTVANNLDVLLYERDEVAMESLKDTFLSRKDSEGLMLLEAVQKQLKKKRKKNEVPNNSTTV